MNIELFSHIIFIAAQASSHRPFYIGTAYEKKSLGLPTLTKAPPWVISRALWHSLQINRRKPCEEKNEFNGGRSLTPRSARAFRGSDRLSRAPIFRFI